MVRLQAFTSKFSDPLYDTYIYIYKQRKNVTTDSKPYPHRAAGPLLAFLRLGPHRTGRLILRGPAQ